jgi:S-adenosylmethionine hydrolase
MIVLFTDFGSADPYVGQVKARLAEHAPGQMVVDLLHQAPDYNAHAGAHLLAAFAPTFPPGSVFLAVVDPGVGSERGGAVVMAGGRWFVGPDNGLLSVVAARDPGARCWRIVWRPEGLSHTFHGRDMFAVIAAEIARGEFPHAKLEAATTLHVQFEVEDLARIIYIDHFGDAWTGLRAEHVSQAARITAGGHRFAYAPTFSGVDRGAGLWFANSVGLLELAVNRGNAAQAFDLKVGDRVQVERPN